MHIRLLCIGRLKDGPERTLVDDYLKRARAQGSRLGWREVSEIELASGGGTDREGARLMDKLGPGVAIRLDERGEALTSQELSKRMAKWRDSGQDINFLIGGADGFAKAVSDGASTAMSFGVQTWPHKLVRVMLAEQIYRALSIEGGSPYHRE